MARKFDCNSIDAIVGSVLANSKRLRDKVVQLSSSIRDIESIMPTLDDASKNAMQKQLNHKRDELDALLIGSLLNSKDRAVYKNAILSKVSGVTSIEETYNLFEAMDELATTPFNKFNSEQKEFLRVFGIKRQSQLDNLLSEVSIGLKNKFAHDLVLNRKHDIRNLKKKFKVETDEELIDAIVADMGGRSESTLKKGYEIVEELGEVRSEIIEPRKGAVAFVQDAIDDYMQRHGMGEQVKGHYAPVDLDRAKEIADVYDALPTGEPTKEAVKAYKAFAKEVDRQYRYAIDEMGIRFEFVDDDPYSTSKAMIEDVEKNKRLKVFTGGEPHPFLSEVDESGISYNDKFRAIHDLFGHASGGYNFTDVGEENAWLKHAQMFQGDAQRAMSTETRGQNSWVNYGQHLRNADGSIPKKGDANYIPPRDRPFAEQKVGLLPENYTNPNEVLYQGTTKKYISPDGVEYSSLDEIPIEDFSKTGKKQYDPYLNDIVDTAPDSSRREINNYIIASRMFDGSMTTDEMMQQAGRILDGGPSLISRSIIEDIDDLGTLKDKVFRNISGLQDRDTMVAFVEKFTALKSKVSGEASEFVSALDNAKAYLTDRNEFIARVKSRGIHNRAKLMGYNFTPTKSAVEDLVRAKGLRGDEFTKEVEVVFDRLWGEGNFGIALEKKLKSFVDSVLAKRSHKETIGLTTLTREDLPYVAKLLGYQNLADGTDDIGELIYRLSQEDNVTREIAEDYIARLGKEEDTKILKEYLENIPSYRGDAQEIAISIISNKSFTKEGAYFINVDKSIREKFSEMTNIQSELFDEVYLANGIELGDMPVVDGVDDMISKFEEGKLTTIVLQNRLQYTRIKDSINAMNTIAANKGMKPVNVVYPNGEMVYSFIHKNGKIYIGAQDSFARKALENDLGEVADDLLFSSSEEYASKYDEFMRIRYGSNAEKAQEAINRDFGGASISEVEKKLELVSKIDNRFLDRYVDLEDAYSRLPNNKEFYRDYIQSIADNEGYSVVDDVITDTPIDDLKNLYMRVKYHTDYDDYINAKVDYLSAFGYGYNQGRDSYLRLHYEIVNNVEEAGFVIPHLNIKPFLQTIDDVGDVDDRGFISTFIGRNKGRPAFDNLSGSSDYEKVVGLFRNIKEEVAGRTTPRVTGGDRLRGFQKVREYLDNGIMRVMDDDVSAKMIIDARKSGDATPITAEYRIRTEKAIDAYQKEMTKALKDGVNEDELSLIKRKAQIAIVKLEEELLDIFGDLFPNKKELYTKKFDVYKVNTVDDIDAFNESIEQLKTSFKKTYDKVEENSRLAKNADEYLAENGLVTVLKDGKYVSSHVDDMLASVAKDIPDEAGELGALKHMDTSGLSNRAKLVLYKVAKVAKATYGHSTGPAELLYTKLNPELSTFFVDYQLVEDSVGMLPRYLKETNNSMFDEAVNLGDRTDKLIKYNILKDISSIIRRRELTPEDLQKAVRRNVNIAQDEIDNMEKAYEIYYADFEPYTKIKAVSKENEQLFKDLTKDKSLEGLAMDRETRDALNNTNIETSQGRINLGSYMFGESSDSLPRVILSDDGSQKFGRDFDLPEEAAEARASREKKLIERWRDGVEELDDFAKQMETSMFQQALPIMYRNPRTKLMADAILANIEKGRKAFEVLKGLDSWKNKVAGYVQPLMQRSSWFNSERLARAQEIYKQYIDLSDEAFEQIGEHALLEDERVAHVLADYFRSMRKALNLTPDGSKGVSVDPDFNQKLWNMGDAFLKLNPEDYIGYLGFRSSVERGQILRFVQHNFEGHKGLNTSFGGEKLGGMSTVRGGVENIEEFNMLFDGDFSKGEVTNILTSIAGIRLGDWANKARMRVTQLLNFLAPPLVRTLYAYPYSIITSTFQSWGYATKIKSLSRQLGVDLYEQDPTFRKELGILNNLNADFQDIGGDIDEIYRVLSVTEGDTPDEVGTRLAKFMANPTRFLKSVGISMKESSLDRLIGQVKDNGNNIIDALWNPYVKEGAFMQALRDEGFFGVDNLKRYLSDESVPKAIRDEVVESIRVRANRIYAEFIGISENTLFDLQYNGRLAAAASIPMKLINFRGGWGMSNLRGFMRNIGQSGKIGKHLIENRFSKKSIDEAVEWAANTPEYKNWLHAMWTDAYYVARFSRLQNTGEYDEEITFSDIYDTFEILSQGFQAIQSAGPMRPSIAALESSLADRGVFEGIPEGSVEDPFGAGAFLNSYFQNFAREAKFLKSSAVIAQAYANHLRTGSDWLPVVAEQIEKLSNGSLRYMFGDTSFRKSLTADTNEESGLPTVISGQAKNTNRDYLFHSFSAQTWAKLKSTYEGDISLGEMFSHLITQSNIGKAVKEIVDGRDPERRGERGGNYLDFEETIESIPAGKEFVENGYRFVPKTAEDYADYMDYYKMGKKGVGENLIPGVGNFDKAIAHYKEGGDLGWWNQELTNYIKWLDDTNQLDKVETSLRDIGSDTQRANFEIMLVSRLIEDVPEIERPVGYQKIIAGGSMYNTYENVYDEMYKAAGKVAKKTTGSSAVSENTKQRIIEEASRMAIDSNLEFLQEADILGNIEIFGRKMIRENKDDFVNYITKTGENEETGEEYHNFQVSYRKTMERVARTKEDIDNGDIDAFLTNFNPIIREFDYKDEDGLMTLNMINQTFRYIYGSDSFTQAQKNQVAVELLTSNPSIVDQKDEFIARHGKEGEALWMQFVDNIHRGGEELIDNVIADATDWASTNSSTGGTSRRGTSLNIPAAKLAQYIDMMDKTRGDKYKYKGSPLVAVKKVPRSEDILGESILVNPTYSTLKADDIKGRTVKSEGIEGIEGKKSRTRDDIRRITKGDKPDKFTYKEPK